MKIPEAILALTERERADLLLQLACSAEWQALQSQSRAMKTTGRHVLAALEDELKELNKRKSAHEQIHQHH